MALLYVNGFDHSARQVSSQEWNINSGSRGTPGRTGTHFGGNDLARSIGSNLATAVFGSGFLKSSPGGLFQVRDSGSVQLSFESTLTGALEVKRGDGTSLGITAGGLFFHNLWNYVEFKCTINNSTGSIALQINGVPALSVTGIDTQNTGNAFINQYAFTGVGCDDHYLCDTTGSVNNDFLGDVKIETLYVTGAGNSTQWTPLTGSNFQNVDEQQDDDGDTTYNSSSTSGNKDTFATGNLITTSGTVYGSKVNIIARKDDAGTREVRTVVRSSSTEATGASRALTTSYILYGDIFELDPNTSALWTVSGINAMEIGYDLVT